MILATAYPSVLALSFAANFERKLAGNGVLCRKHDGCGHAHTDDAMLIICMCNRVCSQLNIGTLFSVVVNVCVIELVDS